MKQLFLIFTVLLLYASCKPKDDDIGLLKIINRSNESVLIAYSKLYPDTVAYEDKIHSICRIDLPDTTCDAYSKGWKGRFNENSQQTLVFLVYNSTDEFTNPTKRIIIDLDSMERANWKLYVY